MRETKAIIGKAPRLWIHTPKCHAAVRPCGSFSRGIFQEHNQTKISVSDTPHGGRVSVCGGGY